MNGFMKFLYDHYALVTMMVVVFLALFVTITVKVFFFPVDIPTGTVAAYGTFFSLITMTIGLWKWRRGVDVNDTE